MSTFLVFNIQNDRAMGFFFIARSKYKVIYRYLFIYVFKMVLTMTLLSLLVIVRSVVSFLLKKIIVI